jgi:hypothetical protein
MDHYDGYYGMRRKRNIDLSRFRHEEPSTSMKWEEELEEGYEYEEVIEYDDDEASQEDVHERSNEGKNDENEKEVLLLNGKPFMFKEIPKKETFAESHVRVTTYIEKNLHQIIRMLQKQKQIESITRLINDSIKDHLMNKYHNNN